MNNTLLKIGFFDILGMLLISFLIILPIVRVFVRAIYSHLKLVQNKQDKSFINDSNSDDVSYVDFEKEKQELVDQNFELKKKVDQLKERITYINDFWMTENEKQKNWKRQYEEAEEKIREINNYWKKEIDNFIHQSQKNIDKIPRLEDANKKLNAEKETIAKTNEELIVSDKSHKIQISLLKNIIQEKDNYYAEMKAKPYETASKVSQLYTDFLLTQYEISANFLENKSKPALKEAARIRELNSKTKCYIEAYKQIEYKFEYVKQLFPEINDYVEDFETIQHLEDFTSLSNLQEEHDRVRNYLTKEEYRQLNDTERNQLALDRYLEGRKSNWQIGRDYELYCGQQYEKKGWKVHYFGIEKKLNDLGRDLIAEKGDQIHVIQCKFWSKSKTIHEKHITQLFGTTKAFAIEQPHNKKITPVFITNTKMSSTARDIAKALKVKVIAYDLSDFPRVKCNINRDETGKETRIYHLPFDQQYDNTKINKPGEFYAFSVKEAVDKGFRRAFRYMGPK